MPEDLRLPYRLYHRLLLSETLYPHLAEIEKLVHERMDQVLPQMMESAGVTEELKAHNPIQWVGLMNALKAQVEEILMDELIFS